MARLYFPDRSGKIQSRHRGTLKRDMHVHVHVRLPFSIKRSDWSILSPTCGLGLVGNAPVLSPTLETDLLSGRLSWVLGDPEGSNSTRNGHSSSELFYSMKTYFRTAFKRRADYWTHRHMRNSPTADPLKFRVARCAQSRIHVLLRRPLCAPTSRAWYHDDSGRCAQSRIHVLLEKKWSRSRRSLCAPTSRAWSTSSYLPQEKFQNFFNSLEKSLYKYNVMFHSMSGRSTMKFLLIIVIF